MGSLGGETLGETDHCCWTVNLRQVWSFKDGFAIVIRLFEMIRVWVE